MTTPQRTRTDASPSPSPSARRGIGPRGVVLAVLLLLVLLTATTTARWIAATTPAAVRAIEVQLRLLCGMPGPF